MISDCFAHTTKNRHTERYSHYKHMTERYIGYTGVRWQTTLVCETDRQTTHRQTDGQTDGRTSKRHA